MCIFSYQIKIILIFYIIYSLTLFLEDVYGFTCLLAIYNMIILFEYELISIKKLVFFLKNLPKTC